ncbi:MAG TPA: DNA mismatch repair protein MutT [Chloroflexi bacterium]|jgi:ADP-ribose pyrophosphatase YjhB (NUDIX family)|nr:DNA mismatch repair protein MutT [Chloroflexota bacterium]HAF18805.1 DNA mismatch repair protein MutT [Chloroflexota bacterium]
MAHYCIKCGSQLETRVIEGRELEACPNDDFVLWRDPKVASAVVVEVDGGVVLGRRSIDPGYGLWCLPGGFVNDDEHPAGAAMRECMEEIGAAVELTSLIGVYHVPKRDAHSMVGIAYRARLADGAELSAGSEMLEVRVFPLDSLPALAFPSHRHVLDEFLKSRASVEAASPQRAAEAVQRGKPPSPARAQSRRPRTR